jgi:tyrosyl-tRNA synthetase
MNALEFLINLDSVCFFMSRERKGKASKSEFRRWIKNGSFLINGEKVAIDEILDFPIFSVVLFPKGKKITLF